MEARADRYRVHPLHHLCGLHSIETCRPQGPEQQEGPRGFRSVRLPLKLLLVASADEYIFPCGRRLACEAAGCVSFASQTFESSADKLNLLRRQCHQDGRLFD